MICEAWAANEKASWERSISSAWHTEAFARTKKLPKLEDLLDRKTAPREMNLRESVSQVFAWLKASGPQTHG